METQYAITIPVYFTLWSIFFVAAGLFLYVLDRKYGRFLYRWLYNATHENELAEKEIGFIYKQSTKRRLYFALVFSTVQSLLFIGMNVNPLFEMMMWLLEAPIMFVGFYFGPVAFKLWESRQHLYEKIERMENGITEEELVPATETVATSEPAPAPEPEVNYQERLDNLTKKTRTRKPAKKEGKE